MSKKIKAFLAVCIVVVSLFGLAGCKNLNKTLEDCISEVHDTLLMAQDDNFLVEVVGGKIEKDYALDGKKTTLQDFVSIKVKVKEGGYDQIYADFTLQNTKYSQQLTMSPVDNTVWTATIKDTLPVEALNLSVLADDAKSDYQLKKVANNDVKPLDLLKDTFKDEIMSCFDGEKFNCEVSVRIVKSPNPQEDKYFWSVIVYKVDKTFFGLMIDGTTGEIVAKKS